MKTILSLCRLALYSAVMVICLFVVSTVSFAATITVMNTNDAGAGSLRKAIIDSMAGDTIEFAVAGTITLTTGEININKDLTIQGPGADMLTISGNNSSRIFYIQSEGDIVVSISGLMFINGSDTQGGAILNVEELTIDSCAFEDNSANFGGAIHNSGSITGITNSTFSGNSAAAVGGAILNKNTITVITNSTFSNNEALGPTEGTPIGGGIFNEGTITEISNSTFSGNSAGAGGALDNVNSAIIEAITNSTFSGNSATSNGGAIRNSGTINISFTTIANNEADIGGGILEAGASINIRNSIVAFNTATTSGDNCNIDIANEAGDETNNYSDDDSCGFGVGGDIATIVLDPAGLSDNGGTTETIALLGGDPLEGASADCDAIHNLTVLVPNDHRDFPRPSGVLCDSGAYEGSYVEVKITKITTPPGLMGFPFSGSMSFENAAPGCEITDDFTLDDLDMVSCIVPFGDYTITETLTGGEVVAITCLELPEGSMIDSLNGTLSFTVDEEGDHVDCLFINSFANTVVRITEEPAVVGGNCDFGGVKIESGFDTNQNGVLDDEEVIADDTLFICNGAPGDNGDDGDDGDPGLGGPPGLPADDGEDGFNTIEDINIEPAGANCANGGFRFDKGLDLNRNGVLDPEEIDGDLTTFVCNGVDGADGVDGVDSSNNGCAVAGTGTSSASLTGLMLYALLPAAVFLRRRIRKKTKNK